MHAKQVTGFIAVVEKEANVLDHEGCNSNGTNEGPCLLMHQPKQSLDRSTIFMQGCLSLSCPVLPAPAPFSSPFNHCLFTLSQELNEPWLRALPGKLWRPRPAAVSLPPSLPPHCLPQQPHPGTYTHKHRAASSLPHTSTEAMGECIRFLSQADTEAFCGWITPPVGHH